MSTNGLASLCWSFKYCQFSKDSLVHADLRFSNAGSHMTKLQHMYSNRQELLSAGTLISASIALEHRPGRHHMHSTTNLANVCCSHKKTCLLDHAYGWQKAHSWPIPGMLGQLLASLVDMSQAIARRRSWDTAQAAQQLNAVRSLVATPTPMPIEDHGTESMPMT